MHFDVFGASMIVINSAKIARELLDKRSNVYSDRPHFVSSFDAFEKRRVLIKYHRLWLVTC